MNKNYQKGARLERRIVNTARSLGLMAFRSAGSHSKIDVCIIDTRHKKVRFIQSKAKKLTVGALNREFEGFKTIDDEYFVRFQVIDQNNIKQLIKELKDEKTKEKETTI
jgi:hypothetical protein